MMWLGKVSEMIGEKPDRKGWKLLRELAEREFGSRRQVEYLPNA